MIYGVARNLNYKIWSSLDLFVDLQILQKRKRKRFPKWAGSRAAAVRTERGIAIGPAQRLVCAARRADVEGGFTVVHLRAGEADQAEAVST